MGARLYVYDVKNLKAIRNVFTGFDFYSVAQIISTEIAELEDLDKSIIDITNVIISNHFDRIVLEKWLNELIFKFDNLYLLIQSKHLTVFLEEYPYMFDEDEIYYDFQDEKEPKKVKLFRPIDLIVYEHPSNIRELCDQEETVVSLSALVELNGTSMSYNLQDIILEIKTNRIIYIDISSIVAMLKIRSDLIFYFESLIYGLQSKFCIENGLEESLNEIFPFVFGETQYVDEANIEEDRSEVNEIHCIDYEKIISINEKIDDKLQGHADFKEDFKQNLLKFSFLNKIGERKILSILLCGDSGIGKTEFAKIASKTLFPNEPLIKISFGNYSTEGVLNSLIGAPLGYIGSEDGGELINKLATSNSKVILIDEFERATPSVYNFFYELLEDGKFTDRHGVEHCLNEYIIILTSNMSPKDYQSRIPNSLKSRIDMVYHFLDLLDDDKDIFIKKTAVNLVEKLAKVYGVSVDIDTIEPRLKQLVNDKNLREIKRNIEDIVFENFLENYRDRLESDTQC